MEKKKKLLLIDGSSVAFRAFFALYNQIDRFKSPSGLHTNAIYGFHLMLNHLLERINPSHILVAFDAGKTTFRTDLYADYKGGRAKTPDEFREQLPFIRQMLDMLGIRYYDLVQYEADDIIGTLDKMAEQDDYDVTIVSGDKDLIQLTDANTVVEISKKGVAEFEEFTPAYLKEKMGISPSQFIDLKALMGDKSDNIPGVTKIGEKTGLKLLLEYGSLEGIYDNIDQMKASKMKENLVNDKEKAFLAKKLTIIDTQAPIELGLDDLLYQGPQLKGLARFYDEMGFKQLRQNLDMSSISEKTSANVTYTEVEELSPDMLTEDSFFHFEILGDNYHTEDLVGFAWGNAEKIYVSQKVELLEQPLFKEFLERTALKVYDFKRVKVLLNRWGITLPPARFDSRLAKYLLSTVENNEIATIASLYGRTNLPQDEAVYGKGAKRALPEKEVLLEHLARKVAVLVETEQPMIERLMEHDQLDLLLDMEQPLAYVLAKMEIAGIKVERETLQDMQAQNEVLLEQLTKEIYELAGEEFNINSPKQLGTILFDKLGLPTALTKKTKTGYSTAVDVLEKLAPIAPIVAKILDYRQIAKIQSTYVIGLQESILPDGKIHTRYVQDLTQTGRLSSVDPNLQNIPVRLEQGRLIRKAFVPEWQDSVLLSSDYSQIELRVLAHISGDQHLIDAFKHGADIHTSTAMRVFGIEKPEDVTPNDRRNAKAVNFGVVYGISDFGLSNNLGISRKEAKSYIDTYFERYPGIKHYMENVVREARDKGYVETLFHRRREIPDINSRNFNVRGFAERTAINSPIQGSAADILKIAMIRLDKALEKGTFQTRMLLQVHDEIVLEVPNKELEAVRALVKQVMEEAIELAVPLEADENAGKTWYEAK
ncbi:DNA polymerase I [Streptococcus massiliensis]|uniref:DNA polymerase I n=1 Tax=Streptococcus massiliensis TaxID=313439 RepID=A0A380L0M2_9STRE|nr:DNA polymerase I [Streptococcus massiliensis]SUN76937.1 DNA polymerase I [Streptococcus massiliensis]